MSADLAAAIEQYAARLTAIQQPDSTPTVEQVLGVLLARDQIQHLVTDHTPDVAESMLRVYVLDDLLRQQAEVIYNTISPRKWHGVIHPHPDDWWWFLEQPPATHWTMRFDWLGNSLAVIWLMAAVALSVDVGRRFLSISPDTLETFILLGEASVAFLAAGGALTTVGRKLTDRFLRSFGVPVRFLQVAKAVVAVLILLGLIGFRLSLPDIARFYNNRGVAQHQAGRLTTELRDFLRALSLDPNYIAAHYNLGLVYEDMGDFEEAAVQYRFATQGDFDQAFINLARFYILDGAYSQAASLLEVRLLQAEEADVRYDMLKNLAWARIDQERYAEALTRLQEATELRSELAPAHCLIAQALEGLNRTDKAQAKWEDCLAYDTAAIAALQARLAELGG